MTKSDAELAIEAFLGGRNPSRTLAGGSESNDRPRIAFPRARARSTVVRRLRAEGMSRVLSFGAIPSSYATRWLIPIDNKRWAISGFGIYQPFNTTAKMLKKLLVYLTNVGWTGWARDTAVIASREPLEIESLVTQLTGELRPVFSLALGTMGTYRKLSIRVMRPSGELLGYIKVPLEPAAIANIRHEAAVLEQLCRYHSLQGQVPRLLHAGEWGATYMLFQTGRESYPAPVEFGDLHRSFLQRLRAIGSARLSGEEVVGQVASRWKEADTSMPSRWRALGERVLRIANAELGGRTLSCGLSHGDFTPWNTLLWEKELFVFDWESAAWHIPDDWDAFHFHVQSSVFLKRGRRTSAGPDETCAHARLVSPVPSRFSPALPEGRLGRGKCSGRIPVPPTHQCSSHLLRTSKAGPNTIALAV